jgi:hypothetical protein
MKCSARRIITIVLLLLFCTQPGCGILAFGPSPMAFFGAPMIAGSCLRGLHEGTGWLLNKDDLKFECLTVRSDEDSETGYAGDFKLNVTHKAISFTTTARDVPCDKDGIPSDEAFERLNGAIDGMKCEIRKLKPSTFGQAPQEPPAELADEIESEPEPNPDVPQARNESRGL